MLAEGAPSDRRTELRERERRRTMERIIFHCDLNCFYASVELLSHPELREVPVAVAGDPASRHGIILAKNEPAKQCGVKTAETIWQARRKCPELVLLPAHHKLYHIYSKKVNAIYDEYAKTGLSNREIWRRYIYPIYSISEKTFYNYINAATKPAVIEKGRELQLTLFG